MTKRTSCKICNQNVGKRNVCKECKEKYPYKPSIRSYESGTKITFNRKEEFLNATN